MNAARPTVVPTFDVELFAQEAARLTVVPPSNDHPTWTWLNETSVPEWVAERPIREGDIDHRTAFLLLHVDGVSTLRDIVKNSGIARKEALGILANVVNRGFVWLREDEDQKLVAPEYQAPAPISGIRDLTSSIEWNDWDDDLLALDALAANANAGK